MSGTDTETAKGYVAALVGDAEARAPGPNGRPGKPYWHLFAALDEFRAEAEYHQVAQLPEHARLRDMMERLGLDGRAEGTEG